ncbi:MAG: hypothetical protein M1819_002899 [Sarea resinae]|nr:MAG: hypothetical protein M1819_002899 [Sarea resinae]
MDSSRSGSLRIPEGFISWKYEVARSPSSKLRPTLVFLHAAVADHTLWNTQIEYLTAKEWNCLSFDLFGFGQSKPSKEFLESDPRRPINHLNHLEILLKETLPVQSKVILIGLSMGGLLAPDFALVHPGLVSGLVTIAGGVRGSEFPNKPEEDNLFDQETILSQAGSIKALAKLKVRIWGDGPPQKPGRLSEAIADKMYSWCLDIAARECAKEGGTALEDVAPEPFAFTRLHEIRVPTAVAFGAYDESNTTAAMKYVGRTIERANVKAFEAAHMINLEVPEELNAWLGGWLEAHWQ